MAARKYRKPKRPSFESAFEGLMVSSTSSPNPARQAENLGKSLRNGMRSTLRLDHGIISTSHTITKLGMRNLIPTWFSSQLEPTYEGREEEEEKPVMHKEMASLVLAHTKSGLGKLIQAIEK
ncbi:uncharacterized protein N7482_002482 [Penicillium canariense]|uniref:Uncharacterized protein n=1 Tax=Penicillium canariense TaxID=189055 RepID=A0A9W9IIU2_9EURO|nr:uncharacterized protein N7482_002482 [Penicillium canariense]KAJ5176605.1 hypothetical protein N7482_002482 [Penicillium canariense]